jgi:hypothetical protein
MNNTVKDNVNFNYITIVTEDTTQVQVSQPITNVVEVLTGPIGPRGDFSTSGSIAFTGSFLISGSLFVSGSIEATQGITGSLYGTSSWALNSETASYIEFDNVDGLSNFSSSVSNRLTSLENFSSSLDATFATDAELNSATASLSSSISYLSGSYLLSSASFSASISDNSSSISLVSSSFSSFVKSYNTGSFTGSFTGDLFGTSSYALQALSSSFASTASYVNPLHQNVIISGSLFVTQSHISTVDYIDFTLDPIAPFAEGRLQWIDDTKTLNIDTDVNNFSIEVGHQNVVRVRNVTGGPLAKGKIVYINGESGNRPTVVTASWDGDPSSAATLGWVAEAINDNQTGYVITSGIIRGVNTNAYLPGTQLYLSSSGDYTSTIPLSPKHEVRLGKTITQATQGTIFIDVMNGYELGELHDVLITSASNGDLITWNSGSRVWVNTKQLSGSYAITGSLRATTFTGSFVGDGSQLTGIVSSKWTGSNPISRNSDVEITGSFKVSGSTTQVGNNNLLGNTTLSGSIIISGALGTNNPTVKIYGDTQHNGYIRFDPVSTNINQSISASYIYVSGSTNDLYFTQNGGGYGNTTRLRWLEGNLYSGLLHGGIITTQSSTVYQVSSGSGLVVDLNASYTDNPYPTITYVNWPNLSASIAPLSASYDQTFVAIQSNGTIGVSSTPYLNGQVDTQIPIGIVLHANRSTINGVKTQPRVAYGWKQRSNVFIEAFGPLKLSGLTLSVSGSSTGSLVVGSGTAFQDGANYTVNADDPAYILDTGTNISKIWRYRQSGSNWVYDTNTGVGYGAIDPTNYSNNGTLTPVPTNNWSIQRVYWFPNSVTKAIVVYYGNATYTTELDAIANINIEPFTEAPNTAANAVYLGALILRHNANFNTAASYKIIPGGLFRAIGGSGGGGGTVTQTLAGLSDTSILSPTNGQPLVYNSTLLKWENSSTLTASLSGNASTATTASYVLNAISSSFATTSSFASTVPASGVIGLNLSQIATGSVSASVTPTQFSVVSGSVTEFVVSGTGVTIGNTITDSHSITGSLAVSGSVSVLQNISSSRLFISSSTNTASGSTVIIYGSGSTQPVFTVQGSQGELFSVTDSLTGSLFSVNDISGLPIMEIFSDNTTLMGSYLDPMLITTTKVTQTNSGSFVVYSLPTASYDTAFFEYSVKSGSNARAGTIMAIQSGSSVNFTETTTTDFGSTAAVNFTVIVSGSDMLLTGSSSTGAWVTKCIIRGL